MLHDGPRMKGHLNHERGWEGPRRKERGVTLLFMHWQASDGMIVQAVDALATAGSIWFMMGLEDGWMPAALQLQEVHARYPELASRPRFAINIEQLRQKLPTTGPKPPSTGWLGTVFLHPCGSGTDML